MTWKRFVGMVLGSLLLAFVFAVQPAQAQFEGPGLESAPCMFTVPEGMLEGQDLACGYLTVPAKYEQPEEGSIRLAFAVIKSSASNPQSDPIFFAQGGPGGSTLDLFPQLLAESPLRGDRDLVLFDQRGTLYSEPNLACPEVFEETKRTLDQDLSDEEANRYYKEAVLACRDRMVSEGIDLSAFNSLENARDIEALRVALGYDQINFYGVSYGTLLGQHLMREFPGSLRSVILDAVVPSQIDFNFQAVRTIDASMSALFNACTVDAECNGAYPDLEKTFFDLVDRLDANPVEIALSDFNTGESYPALLDGDTLLSTLTQGLYSTELLPLLPKMMIDVGAGRYTLIERVLSLVVFDQTVMEGMYYSVICAEDGVYKPAEVDYSGIRPRLLEGEVESSQTFSDVCQAWRVDQLGDRVDQPVQTDIPVLVMNGRFDPVTPQRYGELTAETFTNHFIFTFPNVGHGTIGDSCAESMMAAFIADPMQAPDSSCMETLGIDFISGRDVIDFPVVIRALNLDTMSLLTLGGLIILALIFLFSLLGFPLAWLIRVVRSQPGRPTPLAGKLAPWLAVLAGALLTASLIGLVVAMVQMVQDNDILVLMGYPAGYAWVFALAMIFALISLALLGLSVAGWMGQYWTTLRKVYFTLVSLLGLGVTLMLLLSGALTALL